MRVSVIYHQKAWLSCAVQSEQVIKLKEMFFVIVNDAVRNGPVLDFDFVLFSGLEFESEELVPTILVRQHDRFLFGAITNRVDVDAREV